MTGRRRVLHVFSTFAPAGPQVRTAALMGSFGDAFEHEVLAADGCLDALELVAEGVHARAGTFPQAPGLFGTRRAFKTRLQEDPPDLLCTYNWGSFDAVLAARALGFTRHLHHEDGFNADEAHRRKLRRTWARRWGLARCARVYVPSTGLAEIATHEWGVAPARVAHLVNGVRTDRFTPTGPEDERVLQELGVPAGSRVIGAVGHLRPVKRYDRLLRAFASLGSPPEQDPPHLILVGDGPERARLTELVRELGLESSGRVHLPGHQAELADWYRAFDVLAISSDSEQLPVSLLEGMACALPVASTDVGDVRATLPEGSREAVVPTAGEHGALAAALRALLNDPERRMREGVRNRSRVEDRYSHEAMVAAHRALYDEALGH